LGLSGGAEQAKIDQTERFWQASRRWFVVLAVVVGFVL